MNAKKMCIRSGTALCAAIVLSLTMTAIADATTITVDDFNSALNSNWVQSTVLNLGSTGAYTVATSGGYLTATMSNYDAPRQDVLLRSDYSLGVGDLLLTDRVANLYVTTATARTSYANSIKLSAGQIYCWDNANAQVAYATWVCPMSDRLAIKRTAANVYDLGSYVGSTSTFTSAYTYTVTGAGNLNPGDAIGFFIDQRSNGSMVLANSIELVQTVPEPGACAMLATGLLGLLCYAWRKRR